MRQLSKKKMCELRSIIVSPYEQFVCGDHEAELNNLDAETMHDILPVTEKGNCKLY